MAQKSVKKPAAKNATAKKTTSTKKVAAKKATMKKAAPVITPMMDAHGCGCGNNCHCGANCACGSACRCHGGFGRFIRKLIVFLVIFALGWAAAGLFHGGCPMAKRGMMGRGPNMPRVHFVNGCLDVASVKCPKLANVLPAMDTDDNGCITRAEYRAARRRMRAAMHAEKPMEKPAEPAPAPESVPTVTE